VRYLLFFLLLNNLLASGTSSIYDLDQKWINHEGKESPIKDLGGKPAVVSMIFTSCPGACPMVINNMKSFDKELTKVQKSSINYYAFSIDPKRDTPEVLAKYVAKMDLDSRWTLFTSNADYARELAVAFGFNYKVLENGDFTHSTTIFLLSEKGEILAKHEPQESWDGFLTKLKEQAKK